MAEEIAPPAGPPSGPRMQGKVKWFSNRKCFGFISPDDPSLVGSSDGEEHDVFVHQSSIKSDGFRTLREDWVVEFTLGTDENGRPKAEYVTAPGGGPCTGPRTRQQGARATASEPMDVGTESNSGGGGKGGDAKPGGTPGTPGRRSKNSKRPQRVRSDDVAAADSSPRQKQRAPPQPHWHDSLEESIKSSVEGKGISLKTGTVDIAVDTSRIKLGTGGYSSMARSDAVVAEGTFDCTSSGEVTFKWDRSIAFAGGEWATADPNDHDLVKLVDLGMDNVAAVSPEETPLTLWGDGPSDPKEVLVSSGFLMRRVVLTPPKSRRRS